MPVKVYLKEARVRFTQQRQGSVMAAGNMPETDLLHLFGPLWWVAERHEYTVGQNSTHDDHAEQCEKAKVKEKARNSA